MIMVIPLDVLVINWKKMEAEIARGAGSGQALL